MNMRMKLIFTTALFVALLLTACGLHVISGSGNVVRESRPVSDFTAVNFTGFGELTLVQGETTALTIETDDNLLPYIKTTVDQGTLTIGFDDGLSLPLMQPTDSIRYQLTVKTLTDLALSGAGTVAATALTADHLTLVGSGIGAIKLADLTADAVTVEMSGAGAIELAGWATTKPVIWRAKSPKSPSVVGAGRRSGCVSSSTQKCPVPVPSTTTVRRRPMHPPLALAW